MATYTQNQYNLVDVTKSLAPDQKTFLKTVDLIKQENEIMDDLQWEEGNGLTTHVIGQVVARPTISETADNQGYGKGKDEIKNIDEFACEIGSDNEIDVRTLNRNANPRQFRAMKDDSHVVAHGEKLVDMLFNGNRGTNPLQVTGLYNRAEWAGAASSNANTQILADTEAGGAGTELYDAWVIQHGEGGFKMWYPRGSKAGINIEDKGEIRVYDAAGNPYYAQVTHFDWKFGLGIYDPRNIVRVSNIKPTKSAQALEETLTRAINRLRKRGQNATIYLPRAVFDLLDIRAMNKANAAYRQEDVFGRQVTTFRGVPVRMIDALDLKKYTAART
jgi:hypothetical protein